MVPKVLNTFYAGLKTEEKIASLHVCQVCCYIYYYITLYIQRKTFLSTYILYYGHIESDGLVLVGLKLEKLRKILIIEQFKKAPLKIRS